MKQVNFSEELMREIISGAKVGRIIAEDGKHVLKLIYENTGHEYPFVFLADNGLSHTVNKEGIIDSIPLFEDPEGNQYFPAVVIQLPETGDVISDQGLLSIFSEETQANMNSIFVSEIETLSKGDLKYSEEAWLASEEEKEILTKVFKENKLTWNEDKKSIEDVFEPWDKVLAKNEEDEEWKSEFFIKKEGELFKCLGERFYKICKPWNEEEC